MTSKALLYLLITFIIGFGLGMITDRALQTIHKFRVYERPPGKNIMDDIIGILELKPNQIDSIKPVFEDFFGRAENTRILIMQQAEADMDTLRLNLLPYLTESQIEKIDKLGLFRPGPWRKKGPPFIDSPAGTPPPGDSHRPPGPHPENIP
jgi:hypothetical protein